MVLFAPIQIVWSQSTADAKFGTAYEAYTRKQYLAAHTLLRSVLEDKSSVLRDYSLYYLGRVAMALDNPDSARAWFTQLQREYPNSRWVRDSTFQLVRVDLGQKRYDRALERARSLHEHNTNKEVRARALYYIGQAYEGLGQTQRAFQQYQNIRRQVPRSGWRARSKERIAILRERHPELRIRGARNLLEEAQQLVKERDHSAAEKTYQRVLKETNFRRLALGGLSKVYRRTRQRTKEEAILRQVIRHYSGTADAGSALARIATIQWNRNDNESALHSFRTLKTQYPGHSGVPFATYAVGRIHESNGAWDAAIRVYQNFPKSYPHSRFRADASWRLAWIYYVRANYAAAHASFRTIASRPGNFNIAASFWQAKTAATLGREAEATRLYLRLAHNSKNPYYRGLARDRLTEMGEPIAESRAPDDTQLLAEPVRLSPRASFHFIRAQALARLSLNRFARLELDRVAALSPNTPDLKRFLMREYAAVEAFNKSVALAHQLPYARDTLRHQFPLSYWDIVQRHAAEHDVDPFLVVALIRQESLFNPRAVSPASALGLMQLLHQTARTEAATLGLAEPQRHRLFDPELNIRLGTRHLKRLLTRYSNSGVKALAAYNAGGKPVEQWSKDFAAATDTEFAERIPYKETRIYVKKVMRNYRVYKQLYAPTRDCNTTDTQSKKPSADACLRPES